MHKPFSKCPPSLSLRLTVLVTSLFIAATAFASDDNVQTQDRLTVALAECPPFVIIEDGEYSGLAVYLWEQVGKQMGLSWDYAEYSLNAMQTDVHTLDDLRTLQVLPILLGPETGTSCCAFVADFPSP